MDLPSILADNAIALRAPHSQLGVTGVTFWVRVIVVQLECHQSAQVGSADYLSEPFVNDEAGLPLTKLQDAGIDVTGLRMRCKMRYLSWSASRLLAVLDSIRLTCVGLSQTETEPVAHTLVVFPEYSIPFEHLLLVHRWATDNSMLRPIVFSGTHAVPPLTHSNSATYINTLRVPQERLDRCYLNTLSSKSFMPVFIVDGPDSTPRTVIHLKTLLSPFERASIGSIASNAHSAAGSVIDSHNISVSLPTGNSVNICTLICSEALQATHAVSHAHSDIVVIPAYSTAPPFDSVVEQLSRNQSLVVFCNDGRYGGSGFMIPPATRGENWWFGESHQGRMPRGDAVLIGDVHIGRLGDVTQVNNLKERCILRRFHAVVPYGGQTTGHLVTRCIAQLRATERPASTKTGARHEIDLESRRRILHDCLQHFHPSQMQAIKLHRLLSLQNIDSTQWDLYGDDITYSHSSTKAAGRIARPVAATESPNLRALERGLTSECIRELKLYQSHSFTKEQHALITDVIAQLQER